MLSQYIITIVSADMLSQYIISITYNSIRKRLCNIDSSLEGLHCLTITTIKYPPSFLLSIQTAIIAAVEIWSYDAHGGFCSH